MTLMKEQVVTMMQSSKSLEDWYVNASKVRSMFNGYPDFWKELIVDSGIWKNFLENKNDKRRETPR